MNTKDYICLQYENGKAQKDPFGMCFTDKPTKNILFILKICYTMQENGVIK